MTDSQMLTEGVSGERAWWKGSIDDSAAWYYPLSDDFSLQF